LNRWVDILTLDAPSMSLARAPRARIVGALAAIPPTRLIGFLAASIAALLRLIAGSPEQEVNGLFQVRIDLHAWCSAPVGKRRARRVCASRKRHDRAAIHLARDCGAVVREARSSDPGDGASVRHGDGGSAARDARIDSDDRRPAQAQANAPAGCTTFAKRLLGLGQTERLALEPRLNGKRRARCGIGFDTRFGLVLLFPLLLVLLLFSLLTPGNLVHQQCLAQTTSKGKQGAAWRNVSHDPGETVKSSIIHGVIPPVTPLGHAAQVRRRAG
jgi:hypothetical protein